MASLSSIHIYIAIRNENERSQMEDQLVLDGANVSSFKSAQELWKCFQERPVRFIISDRKFGGEFDGLALTREIRKNFRLPYIYILVRTAMGQVKEIREGLATGVDDYLVKPHNPYQIRSRVLVGMRWLTYIDSLTVNTKKAPAAAQKAVQSFTPQSSSK
ncbi:MAG TPA: response regulator [Candidatus Aquilonibacter sp.]|nr:response regulator [Candidatus Aquilonibacter sp.]